MILGFKQKCLSFLTSYWSSIPLQKPTCQVARCVTTERWVVEGGNGQLTKWKFWTMSIQTAKYMYIKKEILCESWPVFSIKINRLWKLTMETITWQEHATCLCISRKSSRKTCLRNSFTQISWTVQNLERYWCSCSSCWLPCSFPWSSQKPQVDR